MMRVEPKQNKSYGEVDLFKTALQWAAGGRKVAMATVIATWGSASRPVGSQLVVDSDGRFEGSVSGGCVEPAVITEAFEVMATANPKRVTYGVSDAQAWDVGMSCGGRVEIFIESLAAKRHLLEHILTLGEMLSPAAIVTDLATGEGSFISSDDAGAMAAWPEELRKAVSDVLSQGICAIRTVQKKDLFIHGIYPKLELIIVGAVDMARTLARMAMLCDYQVLIIDPRGAFATSQRFPDIKLRVAWPDEAFESVRLHSRSAVVVLTHDPKIDDLALVAALRSDVPYIGALGSRKTHTERLDRLAAEGFDQQALARIHGPVGLDIRAKTHSEIAVSILAEIIDRHRRGGGSHGL